MRITLKDFTGGINRATDPTKMKENEFYDFQNLVIYKLGAIGNAVKRYGLEKYHTESPTTTIKPKQIYQYVTNSKSPNIDKLIIQDPDGKLFYGTQGTDYKDISTSGESTGKVKFLTVRDNLYILNRYATNYLTNKYYDGTNYLDMGLPPCPNTFKIQKTNATTIKTEAGTYYYLITFIYDDGQESSPLLPTNFNAAFTGTPSASTGDGSTSMWLFSQGTTRFVGGTVGSSPKQLFTLTNIPTGNARVKKRRIYRTKKNGIGTFYFLAEINDNTTTTFVDNRLSSDLIDPFDVQHIFKPPIAKYGVYHKDRFFIGNLIENQWTEKPSTASTSLSTSSTGGEMASGTYKYKFAYIYDIPSISGVPTVGARPIQGFYGDMSTNYKEIIIPAESTTSSVTISDIDNSNLYSGRVVIYRTKAGASTYYPVGVTSLNGTTFVDTQNDGELAESINLFEAMGLEKITENKVLPSTVQWSDAGYTDSFPPDNSIEVEANDGDVITGMVSEDDGVLIFKERNIYKLYTDRESSYWMLRKVVSNVGCTDPFSIVTISVNTHLFTSNGQIYLYSNGQVRKISEKIQPIIDGFGTLTNTDVCYDSYRNWVIWTYQYTESSTTVQDIIILDLNFPQDGNIGSWYYFKHYVNLSGTPTRDGLTVSSPIVTKDGKLLFGSTTKEILQYGKTPQYKDTYLVSGVSTDRSIDVLLSKYFDFDEWTMERVMGKFRMGGVGTVTVATSTGSGTKTTTGSDTKVRVNKKISRSATKVQEDYISVSMPENISLEIKEVGFDYEPKHQERGSFG